MGVVFATLVLLGRGIVTFLKAEHETLLGDRLRNSTGEGAFVPIQVTLVSSGRERISIGFQC